MRSPDTAYLLEIQRWEDDGGAVPPDPEIFAAERAARLAQAATDGTPASGSQPALLVAWRAS